LAGYPLADNIGQEEFMGGLDILEYGTPGWRASREIDHMSFLSDFYEARLMEKMSQQRRDAEVMTEAVVAESCMPHRTIGIKLQGFISRSIGVGIYHLGEDNAAP
jgi:hypothetical protein